MPSKGERTTEREYSLSFNDLCRLLCESGNRGSTLNPYFPLSFETYGDGAARDDIIHKLSMPCSTLLSLEREDSHELDKAVKDAYPPPHTQPPLPPYYGFKTEAIFEAHKSACKALDHCVHNRMEEGLKRVKEILATEPLCAQAILVQAQFDTETYRDALALFRRALEVSLEACQEDLIDDLIRHPLSDDDCRAVEPTSGQSLLSTALAGHSSPAASPTSSSGGRRKGTSRRNQYRAPRVDSHTYVGLRPWYRSVLGIAMTCLKIGVFTIRGGSEAKALGREKDPSRDAQWYLLQAREHFLVLLSTERSERDPKAVWGSYQHFMPYMPTTLLWNCMPVEACLAFLDTHDKKETANEFSGTTLPWRFSTALCDFVVGRATVSPPPGGGQTLDAYLRLQALRQLAMTLVNCATESAGVYGSVNYSLLGDVVAYISGTKPLPKASIPVWLPSYAGPRGSLSLIQACLYAKLAGDLWHRTPSALDFLHRVYNSAVASLMLHHNDLLTHSKTAASTVPKDEQSYRGFMRAMLGSTDTSGASSTTTTFAASAPAIPDAIVEIVSGGKTILERAADCSTAHLKLLVQAGVTPLTPIHTCSTGCYKDKRARAGKAATAGSTAEADNDNQPVLPYLSQKVGYHDLDPEMAIIAATAKPKGLPLFGFPPYPALEGRAPPNVASLCRLEHRSCLELAVARGHVALVRSLLLRIVENHLLTGHLFMRRKRLQKKSQPGGKGKGGGHTHTGKGASSSSSSSGAGGPQQPASGDTEGVEFGECLLATLMETLVQEQRDSDTDEYARMLEMLVGFGAPEPPQSASLPLTRHLVTLRGVQIRDHPRRYTIVRNILTTLRIKITLAAKAKGRGDTGGDVAGKDEALWEGVWEDEGPARNVSRAPLKGTMSQSTTASSAAPSARGSTRASPVAVRSPSPVKIIEDEWVDLGAKRKTSKKKKAAHKADQPNGGQGDATKSASTSPPESADPSPSSRQSHALSMSLQPIVKRQLAVELPQAVRTAAIDLLKVCEAALKAPMPERQLDTESVHTRDSVVLEGEGLPLPSQTVEIVGGTDDTLIGRFGTYVRPASDSVMGVDDGDTDGPVDPSTELHEVLLDPLVVEDVTPTSSKDSVVSTSAAPECVLVPRYAFRVVWLPPPKMLGGKEVRLQNLKADLHLNGRRGVVTQYGGTDNKGEDRYVCDVDYRMGEQGPDTSETDLRGRRVRLHHLQLLKHTRMGGSSPKAQPLMEERDIDAETERVELANEEVRESLYADTRKLLKFFGAWVPGPLVDIHAID
ncbi:unnamed protein product [Vitrella brassicaformis CCMP3155]|uniref:Uncharacterized protein n=3 Tax=Vitrella brassicaformis TaxID=1169539 RepID=A0A0G4EP30_VITBC|nr:unnamed protein product [Vitrella brassicaformis CCMP3155]|eukprot:CEL99383.1 unnamed protein product [Vitrella brassicaformis CCMP3155]